MANTNNPHGFMPVRNISAVAGHAKPTYFNLAAANTIIGVGDPVTITGGYVDRAAASTALCGIAAEKKAASAGGTIAVWADPMQEFEAQCDDGTGTITAVAGIGLNTNIVAGNASNGRSIAEIDEDAGATTPTLPLKVMKLYADPKNAYGEFNRLVVKINNHQLAGGTGTLGS